MAEMKKLISAVLIFTAISIIAFWCFGGFAEKTIQVRITQSEIDSLLTKKFPLEKKYLKFVRVTYRNPELTLIPGTTQARIGIAAQLRIGIGPLEQKYDTSTTLLSQIIYNHEKKKLILRQPQCEHLSFPAVADQHRDLAIQAINLTTASIWDEIPIYELKSHRRIQAAARMVLKEVHVEDGTLVFTLGLPERVMPTVIPSDQSF
jgi:hypothetical protein